MPPQPQWKPSAAAGHLPPSARYTSEAALPIAQRLNHDVIFIIFMLSSPHWEQAPLTLSSVCRHWRDVALATPRLWSRIDLEISQNLNYVAMYLTRSKPLGLPNSSKPTGLHISIPSPLNADLQNLLSSATSRFICMKILGSYQFLENEFPILERLEMENSLYGDRKADHVGLQCLSEGSRFPRLRKLCIIGASSSVLRAPAEKYTGFLRLQKLEVMCKRNRDWFHIIRGVSSTIVSLRLGILSQPASLTHQFLFPQLRHLQIDTYNDDFHLELDIDAPLLESVDEGYLTKRSDFTVIRLQNPTSVRHLHSGIFPLDLASYPGLRRLWIRGVISCTLSALQSLQSQISSCPALEAVFHFDRSQYIRMEWGAFRRRIPPSVYGGAFSEICALIQGTGRKITAHEFIPSELDLPWSMQRSSECSESRCEAEISPDLSNISTAVLCGGRPIKRV